MAENNWVWNFISSGPANDSYCNVDLKNTSTDEFVSTFAWEWFSALQSLMNCAELLDKMVKKENVNMFGPTELNYPFDIIYSTGDAVEQSFKELMRFKKGVLLMKKIRNHFGTIDEYVKLTDMQKIKWLEENVEN